MCLKAGNHWKTHLNALFYKIHFTTCIITKDTITGTISWVKFCVHYSLAELLYKANSKCTCIFGIYYYQYQVMWNMQICSRTYNIKFNKLQNLHANSLLKEFFNAFFIYVCMYCIYSEICIQKISKYLYCLFSFADAFNVEIYN